MKNLIIISVALMFVACQTKEIGSQTNQLSVDANDRPVSIIQQKEKTFKFQHRLFVQNKKVEKTDLSGHLIAHSRFLFLDYIDIDHEEVFGYPSLLDKYPSESSLFTPYKLEDKRLKAQYEHLIGSKLKLNNHNRKQFDVEVVDLVIIGDRYVYPPYVAAVLDVPIDQNIYYAWTSSSSTLTYPFEALEDDSEGDVLTKFENSTAYGEFEEIFETSDEDIYPDLNVQAFEHYEGVKYFVVQYNAIGMCESLVDNLTAVYIEKNGNLQLVAMNQLDYYVIDLIDTNGDDYPELLGADFASSIVYTLENGEIEELKQLAWSSNGCPC
jgi:hypothetical protein